MTKDEQILAELVAANNFARIDVVAKRVLDVDPQNSAALMALSSQANSELRMSDALVYAEKALKVDPDNPYTIRQAGILNALNGMHDRGVELTEKAHQMLPDCPACINSRVWAYVNAERYEDAFEFASLGKQRFPEMRCWDAARAKALLRLYRWKDAEQAAQQSLALQPSYTALSQLAVAQLNQGNVDEAKENFLASLQLKPHWEIAERGLKECEFRVSLWGRIWRSIRPRIFGVGEKWISAKPKYTPKT